MIVLLLLQFPRRICRFYAITYRLLVCMFFRPSVSCLSVCRSVWHWWLVRHIGWGTEVDDLGWPWTVITHSSSWQYLHGDKASNDNGLIKTEISYNNQNLYRAIVHIFTHHKYDVTFHSPCVCQWHVWPTVRWVITIMGLFTKQTVSFITNYSLALIMVHLLNYNSCYGNS